MMYPISHFLGSKFTKMTISPSWIVASCSKAQIMLRSTRWCKLYWVAPSRRDFDLSQEHYSSVPILSLKKHVFVYFSATTGWNHSLFSVFATLNSKLTENRQAKPGRFQIRSLKKNFKLHLLHSGNNVQNTYFPYELFISRFSDVLNGFNSSVRRCKNFF